MGKLNGLNLALRAAMEFGIVVAFGYWGFEIGESMETKLLLGFGAPLLGFGFWGSVDFRQAGRLAEPLRLLQELLISTLAAVALYVVGHHLLGYVLFTVSIVHHALVYLGGGTLLKTKAAGFDASLPAPDRLDR